MCFCCGDVRMRHFSICFRGDDMRPRMRNIQKGSCHLPPRIRGLTCLQLRSPLLSVEYAARSAENHKFGKRVRCIPFICRIFIINRRNTDGRSWITKHTPISKAETMCLTSYVLRLCRRYHARSTYYIQLAFTRHLSAPK